MRKMISLLLLLLLPGQTTRLLAGNHSQEAAKNVQQSQPAVTSLGNQDVLQMLKAGLAPEIIVTKIKTSVSKFDTSPASLEGLKSAGVPDAVILAMVKASNGLPANGQPTGLVPPVKNVEVKLPKGTPVEVESAFSISSADVQKESLISFRVATPVKVNGITVIDTGALATARVVKAKKAGHWGRAGQLAWIMQDVVAADGKHIPIQSLSGGTKGESRAAEVTARTAVTGALLIPVLPIAPILAPMILLQGFRKGENAVLPAGKRFGVFVQGDTTVTAPAPR